MRIMMSDELIPMIDNIEELPAAYSILDELKSESVLSEDFSPEIIDLGCSLGFLPMAVKVNNQWMLFLKHHHNRSVMKPEDMIINKKIIKLSKEYEIFVNTDFEYCIDEINRSYEETWLCDELVKSYKEIYYDNKYNTKFYSFILKKDKVIVAGEIGYAVGGCYTSLSGYHTINNSGNIQLAATSKILKKDGFGVWDLGMELPYKLKIGAKVINRDEFKYRFLQEKIKKREMIVNKNKVYDLIIGDEIYEKI